MAENHEKIRDFCFALANSDKEKKNNRAKASVRDEDKMDVDTLTNAAESIPGAILKGKGKGKGGGGWNYVKGGGWENKGGGWDSKSGKGMKGGGKG